MLLDDRLKELEIFAASLHHRATAFKVIIFELVREVRSQRESATNARLKVLNEVNEALKECVAQLIDKKSPDFADARGLKKAIKLVEKLLK